MQHSSLQICSCMCLYISCILIITIIWVSLVEAHSASLEYMLEYFDDHEIHIMRFFWECIHIDRYFVNQIINFLVRGNMREFFTQYW